MLMSLMFSHPRGFFVRLSDRLTGGDLFDYVVKAGPLPDVEAKFVAYQILRALQVMIYSHRVQMDGNIHSQQFNRPIFSPAIIVLA